MPLVQLDDRAFTECYAEWRPKIFGFLVRLTRSRAVAEELVQEAFMKLARSAPDLRDDTNLAAWLYTVARNAAYSHKRWQRFDLTRVFLIGQRPKDDVVTPEELTAAKETEQRLERAMAKLAIADREILLLVVNEELSHDDLSVILNISPAACRKRLERARERLQELL